MNRETAKSITLWLRKLQSGDMDAAQPLWERFSQKVLSRARAILKTKGQTSGFDEEDVLIDVFDAALRAIPEGRFSRLEDRDDLWQVLMMLTDRRIIDRLRRQRRTDNGSLMSEADFVRPSDPEAPWSFDCVESDEPTPEFIALCAENVATLLQALNPQDLRDIASDRLSGFSNSEIAERCGASLRTVERKLNIIRTIWKDRAEAVLSQRAKPS